MNQKKIEIGNKLLGKDEPCYIIAEAGINHNGNIEIAKEMIKMAKKCDADAVKFQTFTAEEFVKDEKQIIEYETQGEKVQESMLKMFKRHEFSKKEWQEIAKYCKNNDITFLSTPQNISNLELLLDIGIPAIKVGSDDLTNLKLLENYSQRGLPVLISTGMAYMSEIDEAVRVIRENNEDLGIFHCISSYPTKFEEVNLKVIKTLKGNYPDAIIGFSDHTFGIEAPIAATCFEMKIYEKHFTLDHNMRGPDHRFSANPDQLNKIVKGIRNIERALGSTKVEPTRNELEVRKRARRSVVAAKQIKKGEKLTEKNLTFKRPGKGIPPKDIKYLYGRKAKVDIEVNELIKLESLT